MFRASFGGVPVYSAKAAGEALAQAMAPKGTPPSSLFPNCNSFGVQLGAFPGLPRTPGGTPEGWIFQGMRAWDALTTLLTRIGCALRRDLTLATGQFTIVTVGQSDSAVNATLAAAEAADQKIHDGEF